MTKEKQTKGFTIIEVVLVLAIAALIFLMVFVAFPALQRSQRDSARKNAVGTVISAVSDYASIKRGALPTGPTDLTNYVKELSDANYVINVVNMMPAGTAQQTIPDAYDTITVYSGGVCSDVPGSESKVEKGSGRQYAVGSYIETGGGSYYCQNG